MQADRRGVVPGQGGLGGGPRRLRAGPSAKIDVACSSDEVCDGALGLELPLKRRKVRAVGRGVVADLAELVPEVLGPGLGDSGKLSGALAALLTEVRKVGRDLAQQGTLQSGTA